MRIRCFFCSKSVSTEVPDDTIMRAVICCPECLESGKIEIPETETEDTAAG